MSRAKKATSAEGQAGSGKAIPPVVLLYGSEPAPMSARLRELRGMILTPGMEAFNHERFSGRELDAIAPVLDACGQLPMMSERRLVELSDPEAVGKGRGSDKGKMLEALVGYLKAPNPTTVLVLSSSGIDGRSRLVTAAKKAGWVEKFEALKKDEDAVEFVLEQARRTGTRIDRATALSLVGLCGTGPSDLVHALERASLHAGEGQPVTQQDLDAVVAHTREAVIFELTDAVGMGDGPRALAVLAHLFHESSQPEIGQANAVLSMLIRQIRLVFAARMAGQGRGAIEAVTGVPPFVARKLAGQARRFDEARLRRAYASLARLDRDLKGGAHSVVKAPYLALQRFVLDVCGALPGVSPRL
ncbi:DNA polymerase III subunit delta [Paraliomyxa miuraensis]|uniref:DNA polymerase III subunit delta n=1 Tax=Paraliomyxa miuraensis TaxID=376150 RepID=UPI002251C48D|nr:DNA polymerase III subunit delta [Paraliomyxa miuraensis]MCX4244669.1 DNA polymerase III subunit delta [Paraliomyxa miuraensis]